MTHEIFLDTYQEVSKFFKIKKMKKKRMMIEIVRDRIDGEDDRFFLYLFFFLLLFLFFFFFLSGLT